MHTFNLKLFPLLFSVVALFTTHSSFAQTPPSETPPNLGTPSVITLTENDGDMQNLGDVTTEPPLPGCEHQVPLGSTLKISLSAPQIHISPHQDSPAYDFATTWYLDYDYTFFPSNNNYSLWSDLLSHDPSTDSEVVPYYHDDHYTTAFFFTFSALHEGYTLLYFRRHQSIYGYDGAVYFNIHVIPPTSQTSGTAP